MSNIIKKANTSGVNKSGKGKLDLTAINTKALSNSLSGLSIPRLFYQLVIFVLDGSGSMTFPGVSGMSKGEEIDKSVKKTLERLQTSKNSNSFDIGIWAYANESVNILPITNVKSFNLNQDINPCNFIEKYEATKLKETIREVKDESIRYLTKHEDKNAQALIIILSDGAIHEYEKTLVKCNELKLNSKITISSILYESVEWQENFDIDDLSYLKENLEQLASSKDLFTTTLDPEEIRKHMIKSISTVSKID